MQANKANRAKAPRIVPRIIANGPPAPGGAVGIPVEIPGPGTPIEVGTIVIVDVGLAKSVTTLPVRFVNLYVLYLKFFVLIRLSRENHLSYYISTNIERGEREK